jgi:hypothetical protein
VTNLLPYGDLESGSLPTDISNVSVAFSTTHAWHGVRSLMVTTTSASGTYWAARGSTQTAYMCAASPSTAYAGSLYIWTAAATNNTMAVLSFYNSSGVWISDGTYPNQTIPTSTWTRITSTGTAPAGTAYAAVSPNGDCSLTTNGAVFWTDGWQVETGATATAWTPGPGDPLNPRGLCIQQAVNRSYTY